MKRLLGLLGGMVLVLVLLPADSSGAAPGRDLHLPDLKTAPPLDVRVTYDAAGTPKELRFSNIVYNAGDGPLELRPLSSASSQKTKVEQRVYTHDLTGLVWRVAATYDAGTYSFHRAHDHWHFEGFALYELEDARNPGTVHRTGTKTTFCIIDTESPATMGTSSLEHAALLPKYRLCDQDSITGLSVGWGDKYGYWLAGQSINLSGLPRGTYVLRSTADPYGKLVEKDDRNNAASVTITI